MFKQYLPTRNNAEAVSVTDLITPFYPRKVPDPASGVAADRREPQDISELRDLGAISSPMSNAK